MHNRQSMKKSKLPLSELLNEAKVIVSQASEDGVLLRVIGGLGILATIYPFEDAVNGFFKLRVNEDQVADIDLAGYSKQSRQINDFFLKKLNFDKDEIVNALFGDVRKIFYHPNNLYHVDIFLDKLVFNHEIDIKGRLELTDFQLNPADLLLSKLQIHYLNSKDIIDIIMLMYVIDKISNGKWLERIITILSNDWGFYYDAVTNLNLTLNSLNNDKRVNSVLTYHMINNAISNIKYLLDKVEMAPKSNRWLIRSKIGTKKQWWKNVEEVRR